MLDAKNELPDLLESVCSKIADALGVEAVILTLYDPVEETFSVAHLFGPIDAEKIREVRYPQTTHKLILADNRSFFLIPDILAAVLEHPYYAFLADQNVQSLVSVCMVEDARIIGTLDLAVIGRRREFSEKELVWLVAFSNQAAKAIDSAL